MEKNSLRAYLRYAACVLAVTSIGTSFRAKAQAPDPELSFEVATVKPVLVDASHRFNSRHFWAHVSDARASYWSMTVGNLIEYAYDVEPFQVIGPEGTTTDHFDIEATFPEGANKKDDRRMLQALLKDRFKLAFHIEKRELEGYVLVVGKHGEKLKPSLPDPVTPEADASSKPENSNVAEAHAKSTIIRNPDGSNTIDMGKRGTQTIRFDRESWANRFEMSKMTMEELAARLSNCLGGGVQHVEDLTGIKGNYQVTFDCPLPNPPMRADTGAAGPMPSDPQGGYSLTKSLDALGLRLEKRRILKDVYVIDHVEKPSAN